MRILACVARSRYGIYAVDGQGGLLETEPGKNSSNLKIAMLGHKRIPSREGGVEVVVEELATNKDNIRVNGVAPGVTCSNMVKFDKNSDLDSLFRRK